MKERQIVISLEVVAVLTVLLGVGAYLHFVGSPLAGFEFGRLNLFSPEKQQTLSGPPNETRAVSKPTPSVSPDYAGLLNDPADLGGVVQSIAGNTIQFQDSNNGLMQVELVGGAKLYLAKADLAAGQKVVEIIPVEDVLVGDTLSIYLNDEGGQVKAVLVSR